MKARRNLIQIWLLCAVMLPAVVQAQYTYVTNNGTITITGYTTPNILGNIPSTINGLPVTSIGDNAFNLFATGNFGPTIVTIPDSVTNIGSGAFYACYDLSYITIGTNVISIGTNVFDSSSLGTILIPASVTSIGSFGGCPSLGSVWFLGNAPSVSLVLASGSSCTVYYVAGTTGWDTTFGGRPTAQWNPSLPFTYSTNNGAIAITGYTGPGGVVTIPGTINGLPVTSLGGNTFNAPLTSVTIPNGVNSIVNNTFRNSTFLTSVTIPNGVTNIGSGTIVSGAFQDCSSLPSITIPASVTSIGGFAFEECLDLTNIYFMGNAPSLSPYDVFQSDNNTTIYRMPGTTGWSRSYGGRPVMLWNPRAQTGDASFGVQTNQFGFNIIGSSNMVIVVESCTDLANPVWTPVGTNKLNTFIGTNGTSYFSDAQWTNYLGRFYRFRSP
jgi:hypothetical protein